MMISERDYENGRNFSRMSSVLGFFSSTWAIDGGRLHLILVEYELPAAVEDDVNDGVEVRWEARRARHSSC